MSPFTITWPAQDPDALPWPDVETHETNGSYEARIWISEKPSDVDIGFINYQHYSDENIKDWFTLLTDEQIEAGIQIYYDRWNFNTGSDHDKKMYGGFEEEKLRRLSIRRPHTGDLSCSPDGKMKMFDGHDWLDMVSK